MSSLHDSDRRALLSIARQALVEAAEHRREAAIQLVPEALRPAGAFVTLWKHKKLRGCIGQLEATEPLAHVIAHCACGAALEDPRFEPVTPAELPELEIEISVLSAPFRIAPAQVTAQVKIGEHGLIISRGNCWGVLLPRVAVEQGWTAEQLLDETSSKAGLPRDAWHDPNTRIEAFTAEAFSESEFGGQAAEPGT